MTKVSQSVWPLAETQRRQGLFYYFYYHSHRAVWSFVWVGPVGLLQEFSEPGWIYQKNVDQKKSRKWKIKNDEIN